MSKKRYRHPQPSISEREVKRQKFNAPENRPLSRSPIIAFGVLTLIGLGIYAALMGQRSAANDYFTRLTAGQDFRISLASLPLDQAKFFSYPSSYGNDVRFFLRRGSDGVVRAAYDTCDVCYPYKKGYYQQGDSMVCRRCGKAFPSAEINVVRGGCNPAPLERTVEGGDLVIKASDLEAGVSYF